jgi:hypothetical protein
MRNLIRALACTLLLASLPLAAEAGVFVGVSVNFAPPVLPVYVQPPCPAPGFVWTPGYWAWGPEGYFWVPGTWVLAPVGMLWTPGYWGWADGAYLWHAGYWGPHVGFYGGINYGFGYTGVGFEGGYWRGNQFFYNRTVVNDVTVNRVSFNGGAGGVMARPSREQLAAASERRMEFTPALREQQQLAQRNPALRASANGGHPAIAATPRPGVFSGRGVVAAREARALPAGRGGFAQERRGSAQERYPQGRASPQQRASAEQRARPQQRVNPQERARAPQERARNSAPQERGVTPQGRGGYAQERGGGAPRGGVEPRGQAERRAEPARPPARGNEREGRGEERQH